MDWHLYLAYRIARKFGGGLEVCLSTAKLKFAKFFSACMYVWRYLTMPPNLSPPIVLKMLFGAKLPNLMTTNISSNTVVTIVHASPRKLSKINIHTGDLEKGHLVNQWNSRVIKQV